MLRCCRVYRRTAFVTDVEGDLSYFIRYAEQSRVVSWINGRLTFRDETSNFVYGGDVFDRGDDITFAKALLDFYDSNPSRVHLILGNRDINKMVFGTPTIEKFETTQLSPEAVQRKFFPLNLGSNTTSSGGEKWLSYAEFLELKGLPPKASKVSFVQWALVYKMGAANCFECRRKELQKIRGKGENDVTDAEVTESFIEATRPGGVYYEYLKRGKIAEIIDGALFVHGSVSDQNVGILPDRQLFYVENVSVERSRAVMEHGTAEEWCAALNAFKEEEFRLWAEGAGSGDGMLLRQYAFPVAFAPHSVVVHSLVGPNGPSYLGLDGVEFLNRSGILTVCGGHQPSGDTPSIVQQPGLLSIAADNSYSAGDGTRGGSVVEVLLEEDGSVCIHGRRADCRPYEFFANETLLGRHLGDGWWVKARVGENTFEVQRTRDAYRTKEVEILTAEKLEDRLRGWSESPVGGNAPERWSKQRLTPTRALKTRVARHRHPDGDGRRDGAASGTDSSLKRSV